jgi:hypothetical protein
MHQGRCMFETMRKKSLLDWNPKSKGFGYLIPSKIARLVYGVER